MKPIDTSLIKITDPYVKRAQNNVVEYLLKLDANRFLFEVYKVAGLKPLTEKGYDGWERSDAINFRGHFFGHFLSACALAYHAEKKQNQKEKLLKQMQNAVAGLDAAQTYYGEEYPESRGYISAFREAALDEVEGKEIPASEKENVLVPWYNLHKILAGLLDIHKALLETDSGTSQKALKIADEFGDYIYKRMIQLADKNRMLQIEYGGMNDALYDLFEITHKKEHMIAATYFDEDDLFEQLVAGNDVLAGKHANTMIPKFIGALKRYTVLKNQPEYLSDEEKERLPLYLEAAENFWDITISGHTYCTGGNSQSEHFHEANELYHDAEIRNGDCTCETCNTHNMLKLTRNLYLLTGEEKYLDYYEKTYINAILASQHPETGMMMYFQPMGAGYNKVYNRPYDEFWCCTGTGIESFSKLADTYYFEKEERIFVNLYFSNRLKLTKNNLVIDQETDRAHTHTTLRVQALQPGITTHPLQLALRIPSWVQTAEIKIDGQLIDTKIESGFAYLSMPLSENMRIDLYLQATPKLVSAADNPNYVAFTHGPYVLAGGLGSEGIEEDNPNGILVRVGTKNRLLADTLTINNPDWRENFIDHLEPQILPNKLLAFKVKEIEEEIILTPYYEMHDERYGIYFKLLEKDSQEAQDTIKEKKELLRQQSLVYEELHNFDENNSEYAKKLQYERSHVGNFSGQRYRQAEKEGWFSYEFKITPEKENIYLDLKFHSEDVGKQLLLQINEQKQYTITVDTFAEEGFIT
ncbi:MAG TPA: glycoside hydrolase family 127 protein, partial [Candidatus Jeotgalibaca pullicola]|nr:glycoside hydrolase family 127 protein [Candidatus Jeotgalibaca pullicola]